MDAPAGTCQAIKKTDGLNCTRKAVSGKELCSQHAKLGSTVTKKGDVPIWLTLELPAPSPSNSASVMQKIKTRLKRGPKKTDTCGWIYIYSLSTENGLNYYKIGRTNRRVTTRMKEWADVHGKSTSIVLHDQYQITTCTVDFCERLIHKYLAYCNMYRYKHEKGYHSTWAVNGKVLQDGQQCEERLVAKNKNVEWFCADLQAIVQVVKPLVDYCNGLSIDA